LYAPTAPQYFNFAVFNDGNRACRPVVDFTAPDYGVSPPVKDGGSRTPTFHGLLPV
jgi:hypothetical protein